MAAPLASRGRLAGRWFSSKCSVISQFWASRTHRMCTSTSDKGSTRDPAPLFLDDQVQQILKRITGFNMDKIFHARPMHIEPPQYKLLTDEQLHEMQNEAEERARELLQMPPVMAVASQEDVVISDDVEIDQHTTHNIVFTDITYGVPRRSRIVVVREPNGKLRLAHPEDRDRILQVYTPQEGKMYKVPEMFQEERLEKVLEEGRYEFVLDRTCVQFEPDESEYHRVTQRTYEHIATHNKFEVLRSTRHFGGMSFYFAMHRKIDALLIDMIQRDLLNDAGDLITLFNIIHPESQCASRAKAENLTDPTKLIKTFIETDSHLAGKLELALQTYQEAHEKRHNAQRA